MMRELKPDAIWFLADAKGGGQTIRTKHWQRPEDAGMPHNPFRCHRIEDDPDLSRTCWDRAACAFVEDAAKIDARGHEAVLAQLTDPEFMARVVIGQDGLQDAVKAALKWKDGL